VHENQNNLSERICPHCGALMKEHSHSHFWFWLFYSGATLKITFQAAY
jgi:hypothetical protein